MDPTFKKAELDNLRIFNEQLRKHFNQLMVVIHQHPDEIMDGTPPKRRDVSKTDLYLGRVNGGIDYLKLTSTPSGSQLFPSTKIAYEARDGIKVAAICPHFPNRRFVRFVTLLPWEEEGSSLAISFENDLPKLDHSLQDRVERLKEAFLQAE
ncbi:MAG TPA: hypothetical protein VFA52_03775 [Candidatus Paceibacterota bacterium]|nr:hypothetical protein [Candidatus Paceibacterota bacterium]